MNSNSQRAVYRQAKLKQTEYALMRGWIHLATEIYPAPQDKLSRFATPKCHNGSCQQKTIDTFSMLQSGLSQIKAARFIVPKTLLEAHTLNVFPQTSTATISGFPSLSVVQATKHWLAIWLPSASTWRFDSNDLTRFAGFQPRSKSS